MSTRELCPSCKKNNFCSFIGRDGISKKKCHTPGCEHVEHNKEAIRTAVSYVRKEETHQINIESFTESYRGISPKTLELGGIKRAIIGGNEVIFYPHLSLNGKEATKERHPNKQFRWNPSQPDTQMYMLEKCNNYTKPLCITEGNEDCLSLWELGYQACSLLSADTKLDCFSRSLDKIKLFPEVWIASEQDEAGKIVHARIKELLPDMLIRVIDFAPYKDANEVLVTDRDLLAKKMQQSIEICPLGIIFGNQISSADLKEPLPDGIKLPYKKTQDVTNGFLPGNFWLLTAGVSIGKSAVISDFSSCFRNQGKKVANIFVEERPKIAQQRYIANELGIPIGEILRNPEMVKQEDWDRAFNKCLNSPDVMFITEKWEKTTKNLIATAKYLATVKKYDILILDHITALINSSDSGRSNKVDSIDLLMEQLFDIGVQTGMGIIAVCHLKRTSDNKGNWDEGRKPSMYDLRGSGALEQKPDVIIGMSRNQKNQETKDILQLEVLKNRWFSTIGLTDELVYISKTGRLVQK